MAKTALGYLSQGDKIDYNLNGMAEKRTATYVTRWDMLITAIDQNGNRISLLVNLDRVRPHKPTTNCNMCDRVLSESYCDYCGPQTS